MNFNYGLTVTIKCSLNMGMLVIHLSVLEQNCSIIFFGHQYTSNQPTKMLCHYLEKELVNMKTVHCGEIYCLCFEMMFVLLDTFVYGEMAS